MFEIRSSETAESGVVKRKRETEEFFPGSGDLIFILLIKFFNFSIKKNFYLQI